MTSDPATNMDFYSQLVEATKKGQYEKIEANRLREQQQRKSRIDKFYSEVKEAVDGAKERILIESERGEFDVNIYHYDTFPHDICYYLASKSSEYSSPEEEIRKTIAELTTPLKSDGYEIHVYIDGSSLDIIVDWEDGLSFTSAADMFDFALQKQRKLFDEAKRRKIEQDIRDEEKYKRLHETYKTKKVIKDMLDEVAFITKDRLLEKAKLGHNEYWIYASPNSYKYYDYVGYIEWLIQPLVTEKIGDKIEVHVDTFTASGDGLSVSLKWCG